MSQERSRDGIPKLVSYYYFNYGFGIHNKIKLPDRSKESSARAGPAGVESRHSTMQVSRFLSILGCELVHVSSIQFKDHSLSYYFNENNKIKEN